MNYFLDPRQSGFRKLHSTVTVILKYTDEWYKGLDIGKYVRVIFVNLKKAFDAVDH